MKTITRVITALRFIVFNKEGKNITKDINDALKKLADTCIPELKSKYFNPSGAPNEYLLSLLDLTSGRSIPSDDPMYLSDLPYRTSLSSAPYTELNYDNVMGEVIHDLFWNEYIDLDRLTNSVFWGYFDSDYKEDHLKDIVLEVYDHDEIGRYNPVG